MKVFIKKNVIKVWLTFTIVFLSVPSVFSAPTQKWQRDARCAQLGLYISKSVSQKYIDRALDNYEPVKGHSTGNLATDFSYEAGYIEGVIEIISQKEKMARISVVKKLMESCS